jgi:carbamoyl-phosphate synthase small subunit
MKNKNCFSVQYHPEAGPGPNDTIYLFDEFYQNIKNHNQKLQPI